MRCEFDRFGLDLHCDPLAGASLPFVVAIDDAFPSQFSRKPRVVLAKISIGGHRAAPAAIAKPRSAERGRGADA
jgi:hypothetical protein